MKQSLLRLATLLFLLVAPAVPLAAQAGNMRVEPWSEATLDLAALLPVQQGGRVKPLHTYAGFTLLRLNGKRSIETLQGERLGPVAWLLDTLFFPEAAAEYQVFLIQNAEVVEALSVSVEGKRKRDRYSLNELRSGIGVLFRLADEYRWIEEKDRTTVQQQIYLLASNVNSFMALLSHMDFARNTLHAEGAELTDMIGGRTELAFSELLANIGPIRTLFDQLLGQGERQEDQQAVAHLLQQGTELTRGTGFLALIPPTASVEEEGAWLSPEELLGKGLDLRTVPDAHVEVIAGFERMAAHRGDPARFEAELAGVKGSLQRLAEARGEYGKVPLEVRYYRLKLLDYSQYIFVLAFLLMAFMWLRPTNKTLHLATTLAVIVPTLLLIAAIVFRCLIRERPPVSTLYETVLFVTATGVLVATFIEVVNRQRIAISAGAILGIVGLFIANGYEMLDKKDTMPSLVAVLDTNFWLATHVTAITIGYSAGLLAALLASVYLLTKLLGWKRGEPAFHRSLGRMVYGVLCFGLIFSIVGTILGGIWANDSWGRFWGWDPKENGALLIVLSQIAILHGRAGGYLRTHGVCMAAALGGTVIAFSWWGVNLLGVGLHSYGFTSGIHQAIWTYYYFQWGIVGLGAVAWIRERSRTLAT